MRELARGTGLDVSFISKILSGHRNPPSLETDIISIAKALDIDPDELIIAAGRIPENMQSFFENAAVREEFIEFIKNRTSRKNIVKAEKGERVRAVVFKTQAPDIEDELL